MKKILIALLCIVMVLSMLAACGDNTTDSSNNSTDSSGGTNNSNKATSSKYQYDLTEYITLPDYKDYTVDLKLDEIQKAIDKYLLSYATKADRNVAKLGDVVNVTCIRYLLDENGETSPSDKGDEIKTTFYLGSYLDLDVMERAVVGMSIGDVKNIEVTFPQDYKEDELKGKSYSCEIILNSVYQAHAYDDAFVRNYFEYDTTYDFEEAQKRTYVLTKIYEHLTENATVSTYPQKEYDEKLKKLKDIEDEFYKENEIKLDDFLKINYDMTRDEYVKSEMKKEMIFYAICQLENIEITKEMIEGEKSYLIEYYKERYLTDYEAMDEATALNKARAFVEDLGADYLYENVMFEQIDEALPHLVTVTESPRTYKSITEILLEKEEKSGDSIGDYCPSFELEIFDENGLSAEYTDPSQNLGKITIINIWGTWCGPCKSELPEFDKIATDYKDSLSIYAVHSHQSFNKAKKYVLDNFPNSDMIFVKDVPINPDDIYEGDVYFNMVGGQDGYPFTVILDEYGKIVYQHTGMMSYEDLETILVEKLGVEKIN